MKLSLLFALCAVVLVGCSGSDIPPILGDPPVNQPEASVPPWTTAPSATVAPVQFPEASVPETGTADASDGYVCGWECLAAAAVLENTCTGAVEQNCTIIKDHCGFQSPWCLQPVCQVADPLGLHNYQCTSPSSWSWLDATTNTLNGCDVAICPVGAPCTVTVAGSPAIQGVCQLPVQ